MREPLELKVKSIYCLGVMKILQQQRVPLIVIGVCLIALLVVGALVTRREISQCRNSEYAAFTDQGVQLAGVFARAAGAWLERGDLDALDDAASLLLAGSAQYLRISVQSVVVLDMRQEDFDEGWLLPAVNQDTGQVRKTTYVLRLEGLDIAVPIEVEAWGVTDPGLVQIGFSDSQARNRVAGVQRLVLLLASGAWLAVAFVAVLLVWMLMLRQRLASPTVEDASPRMTCGALVIDTDACTAQLNDRPIELAPKMFELLVFLARQPHKTFSDAELLDALWSEAPYAASGDVKQCIYMLRRRLGTAHPDPKQIIVNVKGFGYTLHPPDEMALNQD